MEKQYAIEKAQAGRELTPAVWGMIKESIAPTLAKAHMMTPEKMAATLLKGYELGLSFTASLELVQVVQGKTSLSPRGALALVQTSPVIDKVTVTRLEDKGKFVGYECYIKRMSGFEYTARFTLEQARAAGLIKPGSGWEHYPENMCMWRAVGFAADVAASDVTCGLTALLKMPEQFGKAIDNQGDIIDAQSVTIPPAADPLLAEVERLCNLYGADAVMAAGNGIPETLAQCAEIEAALSAKGGDAVDQE